MSRILIVTPAPRGSRKGNRVTADRCARLLRELGHRVNLAVDYHGQRCDVLIALHARKSASAVKRFSTDRPGKPLVLTLTGTDLYRDILTSKPAQRSLELAARLVVLQPHGVNFLPKQVRDKARVIIQSALPPRVMPAPLKRCFEVCVSGHLREVKDPFRTALAARRLPEQSKVRVTHLGAALSKPMADRAKSERKVNPRYRWLGEVPRWQARRILARSRILVVSSKLEGGANVVCEALASGTPVLSTNISGSIGLLGEDYPGYFEVGDTAALSELLQRCENDKTFYAQLQDQCASRSALVAPSREREAWRNLLAELLLI